MFSEEENTLDTFVWACLPEKLTALLSLQEILCSHNKRLELSA